jgi:hypothetical protein
MHRSLQYALYAFSSEADPSQHRGAELAVPCAPRPVSDGLAIRRFSARIDSSIGDGVPLQLP